jgi:hypothetical protein
MDFEENQMCTNSHPAFTELPTFDWLNEGQLDLLVNYKKADTLLFVDGNCYFETA